jgi:hypothetical protein
MTIFKVSNEGEARSLMDREPLTKLGLRTYELYPWDLREGRMTIQLNASTSTYKMPQAGMSVLATKHVRMLLGRLPDFAAVVLRAHSRPLMLTTRLFQILL